VATLAVIDWTSSLQFALNILYVAIGLGFVIFFHELGHFVVAKWCDVLVERFSIGFGPILWSFKKGDTEYAISAIPFGGYVKMLGQDDMDPSQLTSDEIALDPRSYSAKSVSKRMAIISAGVIMNVITGLLFFAFAFRLGVNVAPPIIGSVEVGMPAWRAGIGQGDTMTSINGREVSYFSDIMRGVALTTGTVEIEGVRRDGETFRMRLTPDMTGTRRMIGVAPILGLRVLDYPEEDIAPVLAGMAAAQAQPPFQPGDVIRSVDDVAIEEYPELQHILEQNRSEAVTFQVTRKDHDKPIAIRVPALPFRTLGTVMDIERIAAIRQGSPAAEAGLKTGDKILRVNGQDVGQSLNPLQLPDLFASLHGQSVKVDVKREVEEGTTQELSIYVVPQDRGGWIEKPIAPGVPISIPSIGVAYHLIPTVLRLEEGSPAAGQIQKGDRVTKLDLVLPEGAAPDGFQSEDEAISIKLEGENKNWAFAFWMMQMAATRDVRLTVSREGEIHEVELTPRSDTQNPWFVPSRGLRLEPLAVTQKANAFGTAMSMGLSHTRDSMLDIYLTLRNLVGGLLSYKELHGPIGIAKVAY